MKKRTVTLLTALLLLGSLLAGCGQTAVNTAGSSSGETAAGISSEDLSIQEQASSESLSVQEQVSSADLAAASEEESVPYIRKTELDAGQKEIADALVSNVYRFNVNSDMRDIRLKCYLYHFGEEVRNFELTATAERLSEYRNTFSIYAAALPVGASVRVIGGSESSGRWESFFDEVDDSPRFLTERPLLKENLEQGEETSFLVMCSSVENSFDISYLKEGKDISGLEWFLRFTITIL